MEELMKNLPLLLPVIIIQFGLQIYSVISLVRRKTVRFNNKWIWAAVIVFGGLVGAIVYLALKGEDE
jgi:uncharacterized membrane protein YfcA